MEWQCGFEQVSVAAMSSTRREAEIWNVRLQNHHGDAQSENSNQMPFSFICTSSVLFSALLQFLAFGRWKQDVPLVCAGSSIMSKPTLFVTILNSCGLNQSSRLSLSGTDNTGGAGYSIPPLCISVLFEHSFCSRYSSLLYSNVKFEARLLSLL